MSRSESISRIGAAVRDLVFGRAEREPSAPPEAALDFERSGETRDFAMNVASLRSALVAIAIGIPTGVPVADAIAQGAQEIATYRNQRFGFSLSYPTAQFRPQEPLSEEGRVWVSHDGNSRLLAGALPNSDNLSLRDYRDFVLKESYAGAAIDYAPIRDNWFVLSGVRDGVTFYQRVTFACGGRLIKSWAMLYPETEKRTYDRILEQVARSYRPGEGDCG
jgi:hypothetical protein